MSVEYSFGPAKWDCEENLNIRSNSGGYSQGWGEKGPREESRPTDGAIPPSSPDPETPLTRPNPHFGKCSRGGFRLEGAKKATKHTAPALSQVLYFPEVMAKGRRKGRARKGRQSQREQGGGKRGDSKPLFYEVSGGKCSR